jgi:hypothetical protein
MCLLVVGCGSAAKASNVADMAPGKIQLADACTRVRAAMDAELKPGDELNSDSYDWLVFSRDVAKLRKLSDVKAQGPLIDLQRITRKLSQDSRSARFYLDATEQYIGTMERLRKTCQQLGAPLR